MKPEVIENLNGEKKQRKSPVPQDYTRIAQGALSQPLQKRVELRNDLTLSINAELKELEETWNAAKKLTGKE